LKPELNSLLAQLRNRARQTGLPADAMLLLYFIEGFLARLAVSNHHDRFVLKGGLNLYSRYQAAARPTRDIDLVGRQLASDPEGIKAVVREVALIELPDGIEFETDSIKASSIIEGTAYPGVRIELNAQFGRAVERISLDVSFGTALQPAPVLLAFPSLLGREPHAVLGVALETIITEKFAAAIEIGLQTTRYKDFFDLHKIISSEILHAQPLRESLERTFAVRGTPLEGSAEKLEALVNNPLGEQAWTRFLTRNRLTSPGEYVRVMRRIQAMLEPLLERQIPGNARWSPENGVWASGSEVE
jgi:predicted nucleotidyltransferase component of viral defense system